MGPPLALFILGRSTFDAAYAEERLTEALAVLDRTERPLIGSRKIAFDNDQVEAECAKIDPQAVGGVLIVQATFTDAEAVVRITEALPGPYSIWALPEPRTGGRLRLNAFCGLNLAAHALGLRRKAVTALYADPRGQMIDTAVLDLFEHPAREVSEVHAAKPSTDNGKQAERALVALNGARIGRIGVHPAGFDTCAYSDERLSELAGITVEPIALEALFDRGRAADATAVAALQGQLAAEIGGVDAVDAAQLDRSVRLKVALDGLKEEGGYAAFAIRCWPETFTEYGGAVCGPVSLMGERRTPCACEADVYGTLSSLMLQEIAGTPAFLTDIVDMDAESDTTVVWHCGQAPLSMADPAFTKSATIHSNRRMPLLFEFPLKPGRVTLARLSQAFGRTTMVIAEGEVLSAPPSFSGTSGVVRFDRPAALVRERLLAGAIEHHLSLTYGEHRDAVEHVAWRLGIPVLDLTA